VEENPTATVVFDGCPCRGFGEAKLIQTPPQHQGLLSIFRMLPWEPALTIGLSSALSSPSSKRVPASVKGPVLALVAMEQTLDHIFEDHTG
jgi:hypothetical protein